MCPTRTSGYSNEAGKLLRIELDESKRRLWDDLATVFLEGVSYRHIEAVLYESFGHVHQKTGKPFKRYYFYHLLHNPYFWGNSGYGYKSMKSKNGQKVGAWVYDPACPTPDGVQIFYNLNTPVYSGDQAERVQSELRRRAMAIQGKARPHRTHMFSGLLLCGNCGHYLVYKGEGAYGCQSKDTARDGHKCDRYPRINERTVQAWMHDKLAQMLDDDLPDLLARHNHQTDYMGRADAIRKELDTLEAQARQLILKQASANSALAPLYDEQLEALGSPDRHSQADAHTDRA